MKKTTAILTAAALLFVQPASAEWLGFGKKEPIDLNDAKAVVDMLRPSSAGGTFDVYLFMTADGRLGLTVKLKNGMEVRARAGDLKTLLEDLTKNMDTTSDLAKSAAEATRAIINTGKASQ